MKKIKFFILFIAIALINCERDDICAESTSTTPRLIIEFYDATDVDVLKNVPRITVYGEGLITDVDGNPIEPIEESDDIVLDEYNTSNTYLFNTNSNKIALPLKVGIEDETITTRFILEKDTNSRLDTDTTTDSNIDIIEITYRTEFIYVSRACGYKSTFTNLSVTRESSVIDSDRWISNIEIEDTLESTLQNENTTHVRIYH